MRIAPPQRRPASTCRFFSLHKSVSSGSFLPAACAVSLLTSICTERLGGFRLDNVDLVFLRLAGFTAAHGAYIFQIIHHVIFCRFNLVLLVRELADNKQKNHFRRPETDITIHLLAKSIFHIPDNSPKGRQNPGKPDGLQLKLSPCMDSEQKTSVFIYVFFHKCFRIFYPVVQHQCMLVFRPHQLYQFVCTFGHIARRPDQTAKSDLVDCLCQHPDGPYRYHHIVNDIGARHYFIKHNEALLYSFI